MADFAAGAQLTVSTFGLYRSAEFSWHVSQLNHRTIENA